MSALEEKRLKSLAKQLAAVKAKIAANRDVLRTLVSEYEDILETCDRACDDLERAADALSEYL
jgi:ABC-type transporter Mla subunit MlaD